jgi:hypothetical protein
MLTPSGLAQYSNTTSPIHHKGHPVAAEQPSSTARAFALRSALSNESKLDLDLFAWGVRALSLANAVGNMLESGRLGQMIIEGLNAKRSLELGEPMALHVSSCSWDTSKHPGQVLEEGSRIGGERRGGVATRAGEPEAEHPRKPPGPGGIEAKSTATAAVGIPQSPHDRHLPAAFAAAAARFFAPLDSVCSMLHMSPSTQEPLRKSGQTPEAGAPGLAARVGFLSFHAW